MTAVTTPGSPTAAVAMLANGRVWHRRLRPVDHAFSYPAFFLMLPLRAWRNNGDPARLRRRFGLVSFADRDHGDGGDDALAWCDALLAAEGISDAGGEVWLMCLPRVLGHAFKPVSFWFAQRADGSLAAVLVEVNNTFGERHVYLLTGPALADGVEQRAAKVFHVSPFCEVSGEYRFRFDRQADSTRVAIDLHDEGGALLQTGIVGALQVLTRASARRAFFAAPWMSLAVIVRIHWQALRLVLLGLPFFSKPAAPRRFVTR
jgi:DUF1365 family protein